MSKPLLAVTTFPSEHIAREIASSLVDEQLVACVNLLPGAISIYRWKGQVHADNELVALMKTTTDALPELKRRLVELHDYDCPELITFPITDGLPDYLDWIQSSVHKD